MGPLHGLKVIEIAGIGPAPFAAMLLADMGAEVIRIDRIEPVELGLPGKAGIALNVLDRGRRLVAIDLKSEAGRELALRLIGRADALVEGFRPGVMERLGLGPDACLAINPRLVYGRVTGFGQDGPLSRRAGHDINYIALAGVLAGIGRSADEPPVIPLNLIGDFGGGGMFLAFGVVAALLSGRATGQGQVVDAGMIDGAAYLMGMMQGFHSGGQWSERRGSNVLDGGVPWYDVYETADGGYMAVGAIEGRFYAELIARLGLGGETLPDQHDRAGWPVLRQRFAAVFKSQTRAHWEARFADSDACVTPVLTLGEAPRHPHNVARGTYLAREGVAQPAPAPRFSRTVPEAGDPPREPGADSRAVLAELGLAGAEIDRLEALGVIAACREQ